VCGCDWAGVEGKTENTITRKDRERKPRDRRMERKRETANAKSTNINKDPFARHNQQEERIRDIQMK
jgi:hypothetical protein